MLRHRFVLSYEALADGVSADDIIDRILAVVPVPELALRERMARGGTAGLERGMDAAHVLGAETPERSCTASSGR